ncbi:MAG: peptidase M14 [Anaerolineae bacterium]|nr:peptidase M14 [Anaerolineae bacterium]
MRRFALPLSLLALLLVSTPASAAWGDDTAAWVVFDTEAELARLARHLDIWEVQREGDAAGRLLAWVGPAELDWLASQGFTYTPTIPSTLGISTIPDYACYRTVDELYDQLAAWVATYPALTQLHTIGQSYEGRPLQVLRLTNEVTGADKPVFFLMAGIHGRELIAPEAAMVFIERLLTGYGVDPDITWLLDTQVIEVMVTANPDGHVRNETGEPWAYWRKNANPENGYCGGTNFGVDLNRNSGFAWGSASTDACSELYQGPSSVSETETLAVESFMRALFSDQRPDDLISPAPEATSGLFITLHSYSDLVLWPWGHTLDAAPNAAALSQLGHKLAQTNGYTPQQASRLYPASGTTDDFAYGELGIAAYTFEIGSGADGFYPPCIRYDALIEPNVAALLYGAKVTRAPYLLPAGPDVVDLATSVIPATLPGTRLVGSHFLDGTVPGVQIVAELDDGLSGGQVVVAAEAAIDAAPWTEGLGTPLDAIDGAFDADREIVSGTLSLAGLSAGRHLVFVRGQDAAGYWGPPTASFITVTYGMTVSPAARTGAGRPGTTVAHAFVLANTGSLSQTVTLTYTLGLWPTTLSPVSVTQVPGLVTPLTVSVAIPEVVGETVRDPVTVTARSVEAPWLSYDVRLETIALWASSFLPLVLRQ